MMPAPHKTVTRVVRDFFTGQLKTVQLSVTEANRRDMVRREQEREEEEALAYDTMVQNAWNSYRNS
jgi:hypothetical protein